MAIHRIVGNVSTLALAALIAGILQQRPAPGFHAIPLGLPGGVPATLYYQNPPGAPQDARRGIERPFVKGGFRAGVVVAHGFAGDRHTMQALSESLARAGYTVLSLDLSGHGLNRNPLASTMGGTDQLIGDIGAGVNFLQTMHGIESAKIAVLGHSMGARAAIDYGTRVPGAGGLVLLAGSTDMLGPERPRNTLFLYAERDLAGIPRIVRATAAGLAHADPLEELRTYGDFATGTAVRVVQIPGVNHGGLIGSPDAYAEVVTWLDQVTGFPTRDLPPTLSGNPLGPPLLWYAFLLALPGLGVLLARLAPEPPAGVPQARWTGLGWLPVALLLPLPFLAVGRTGALAGTSLADGNVTHLALAGVLLVLLLILTGRFRAACARWPASLAMAAAGLLAVSVTLGPASAYFHGVSLTPEKAVLTIWSAVCLAPLALALQWLLYRPRWWRGTLLRLAARIAVIASVVAGNMLGVFGFSGTIAILPLIGSLMIVEPVLAGFYLRSRNQVTAAGLDALVTAWLFALNLPTAA